MKQDQVINGYHVFSKPTNASAGKCVWAFARKDGEEFFIKEFLDPKRPRPDSMGSPEDKRRRWKECKRFEQRHRQLMTLLRADDLYAGHLVLATDFFPDGTRYYKVTRRVQGADVESAELEPYQQQVLLLTLAESIRLLHAQGIVHGDLKPDNVILHKPPRSDLYTAKLIDFDDSYPAGKPPPRDQVGGNPSYGAPEWLRYLQGDATVPATSLNEAVDMFAFGLLIHHYLFGEAPGFADEFDAPAAAVAAGAELIWNSAVDRTLRDLLTALTDRDPARRPTIADAAAVLAGRTEHRPHPRPSRVRVNRTGRRPYSGRKS